MKKHFRLFAASTDLATSSPSSRLLVMAAMASTVLLLASTDAQASYFANATAADSGYIKTSTRKHSSHRVRIKESRSSSDETPAQRDKRLYRECQGRPNSGACLGYAYPPRR